MKNRALARGRLLTRHAGPLLLGLALLLLTLLSGLALMVLSGGFITASALAGLGLIAMINIFTPGAGIRLAALTRTLARYGERLASHAATLRLLTGLRMQVFSQLLDRPALSLERLRRADAASRLTADIDTLDHLYLGVYQPALGAILIGLLAWALASLFDPGLALVTLPVFLLVNILIVMTVQQLGRPASRLQGQEFPRLRDQVANGLEARLELAALGQLDQYASQVDALSRRLIRRGQTLALFDAAGQAAMLLSGLALLWLTLWLGLAAVDTGRISGTVLAGWLLGILAVAEAWLLLPAAWRRLSQSRIAAERVDEMLSEPGEQDAPRAWSPWPASSELLIENLRFRWDDHEPDLFNGLDLRLPAGQRLALIGASGSGKTTLTRLIMGQLEPDEGTISLGGRPIFSIDPQARRTRIGYLSQNPVLFSDTIAGNLRLAHPAASDAELELVLSRVGLGDWLARLDDGLQTWLDEASGSVSGGEARRLALARLLLTDPPVVILDEPGASLDDETLGRVNQALDAWLNGRTAIIITHRSDHLPPVDALLDLDSAAHGGAV